jgi:hypothetical protein
VCIPRHFFVDVGTLEFAERDDMKRYSGRTRVLFLGACPKDVKRLRLDEEIREIDDALRRSRRRSRFGLHQKHAVTAQEVLQSLLDIGPQIVHFSGHGAPEGLVLDGQDGRSQALEPNALGDLFEAFAQEVECVVLNACYSAPQGNAIGTHINYVIGFMDAVSDRGAIDFARAFYSALGAGRTIEQAYRIACAALPLLGSRAADRPILKIHRRCSPIVDKEPAKEPPRRKWTLVLDATVDDLDKGRVEAILERLRQITQDSSIVLKEVAAGSVVMRVEGSEDAFQVLRYMVGEGGLSTLEGVKIIDFNSGWGTKAAVSGSLDSLAEGSRATSRAIRDMAVVLKSYLDGIGYLKPVTMGDDDGGEPMVKVEDNRQLSEALTRRVLANKRSARVGLVVLCIIGAGAVSAPFAFSGKPVPLAALIAAVFLSFVFTCRGLGRLRTENNTIDICLRLLDELPAEAAAELINLIYWTVLKRSGRFE